MYAILDIETTGGKYNEEGITEIAIYQFNGHDITDQFISLVNPEREIQPFVQNLTGINSKMLATAPKFFEVAKRIVEITSNCIIVAHNAGFDYRILKTEFDRLGFDFERETLCTVELSKELIPGKDSYSLGKLVRSLGIPVSDRHRANGDALATYKLFKLLLDKDSHKTIITDTVKKHHKKQLEPHLIDIVSELPSVTGIYYIYDANGDIIYIGKSKNIKNRVNQHFTGTSSKSKKIQKLVASVTYEKTGSELIALLKESEEIKLNKPKLNRSLKQHLFHYGLYSFEDRQGYLNLKIEKTKNNTSPLTTFVNISQAKRILFKITDDFSLCQKLTSLEITESSCFNYKINKCNGACLLDEATEDYNLKVQKAIKHYSLQEQTIIVIDKGRDIEERSAILIENGKFKGITYYNLNYQINNIDILKDMITPMTHNRDTQHIIQSYLRKHKVIKVLHL